MKKLAIIALTPIAMLISACSTVPGPGYNFYNETVDSILIPGQNYYGNYQVPRQYHVTAQDEQEYNDINARVQQRKQQLQQNTPSTTNSISTTSAIDTNIDNNSASPSSVNSVPMPSTTSTINSTSSMPAPTTPSSESTGY